MTFCAKSETNLTSINRLFIYVSLFNIPDSLSMTSSSVKVCKDVGVLLDTTEAENALLAMGKTAVREGRNFSVRAASIF